MIDTEFPPCKQPIRASVFFIYLPRSELLATRLWFDWVRFDYYYYRFCHWTHSNFPRHSEILIGKSEHRIANEQHFSIPSNINTQHILENNEFNGYKFTCYWKMEERTGQLFSHCHALVRQNNSNTGELRSNAFCTMNANAAAAAINHRKWQC